MSFLKKQFADIKEGNRQILKIKVLKLQNEINVNKKSIKTKKVEEQEIKFLRLNLLYGHKCRKSFFKNQLFKVGTAEYKNCVLKKGNI